MTRISKFIASVLFCLLFITSCTSDSANDQKPQDPRWQTESLPRIVGPVVVTAVGTKTFFIHDGVIDVYNSDTNSWTVGDSNLGHCYVRAVHIGNKAFFLGNQCDGSTAIGLIDILDLNSNSWTSIALALGHTEPGIAVVGTKIIIAGGYYGNNAENKSDLVEILETATNVLTTANLSSPRYKIAAAAIGSTAIFAGGNTGPAGSFTWSVTSASDAVDIYNSTSNTWSTATLSKARVVGTAIAADSKLFFAGGMEIKTYPPNYVVNASSTDVDIYDVTTSSWSTATISDSGPIGPPDFCSIFVGSSVIFCVSVPGFSSVDIYNTTSNTWTRPSLVGGSMGSSGMALGSLASKVFFAGGIRQNYILNNYVSILETTTNTWSDHKLEKARDQISIIVIGSRLFFAGGYIQVGSRPAPSYEPSGIIDIFDSTK